MLRSPSRWLVLTIALVSMLGLATGCGDDSGGTTTTKPVTIDITFSGDSVTPNGDRVKVAKGQDIDLVVKADAPGEIHVHSDPEHEFKYAEGTSTFKFKINRPGVIVVESHTLEETIVSLEVR